MTREKEPRQYVEILVFLYAVAVLFLLWVIVVVAMWLVFGKAAQPGWAAVVPSTTSTSC